jgi:hypothetical protein
VVELICKYERRCGRWKVWKGFKGGRKQQIRGETNELLEGEVFIH